MTLKWQPLLHSTPPPTLHPISPCSSPKNRKLPEGSDRAPTLDPLPPSPQSSTHTGLHSRALP